MNTNQEKSHRGGAEKKKARHRAAQMIADMKKG